MAPLTIRNLTITPLELRETERTEGAPALGRSRLRASITGAVSGLFNATQNPAAGNVPANPTMPDRQNVKGIMVDPFSTRGTDIRAPDPARESLRLTFETPGTGHRYAVEVPGQSPRSLVMERIGDAPCEFTVVYVPSGGYLAIYSSANLSRWMAELHDDYPLSMLSIPGTHNSPACHVALPSVRCQAVGVRAQLDNGVRFLDVRVSASDCSDDLVLVHSVFPISLTGPKYFTDLLVDCYAFLDAQPTEALLMSVKREGTGRGNDAQLARYLSARYCGGGAARRWYTEPRVPTLREARGRIVLVRRFGLDDAVRAQLQQDGAAGFGLDASAWPDNCANGEVGSGVIRVQDFYEVDKPANIGRKIDLARAQLERAAEQLFVLPSRLPIAGGPLLTPLPLFVNFLSGSNFFNASCWPEKIAVKVNPAVIEYLCMTHGESGKGPLKLTIGDAGTGIVVTDWVGNNGDWDLIRCIVGWNAKLQLKK